MADAQGKGQGDDVGSSSIRDSQENPPIKIRPTLFVALGGTGMKVCTRLRRKLLQHAWGGVGKRVRLENLGEFPFAEFLHIDMDAGDKMHTQQTAKAGDQLFEEVQFGSDERIASKMNWERYLLTNDKLAAHPYIASWCPITNGEQVQAHQREFDKGAGQKRPLSRLYFFDQYSAISESILKKLGNLKANLTNQQKMARINTEVEHDSIRIVIVTSIAGGMGSGSMLDAGYLCAKLSASTSSSVTVDLIALTPSALQDIQTNVPRMMANGYASLMELETLLRGSDAVDRWLPLGWNEIGETRDPKSKNTSPFQDIYLVDTGNVAGMATKDVSDIENMIAESLYIDFMAEEFAAQKRSHASNMATIKGKDWTPALSKEKYGDASFSFKSAYSSFGLTTLETGVNEDKEIAACMVAKDMLCAYFGVGPDFENANVAGDKTVNEFLSGVLDLRPVTVDPPAQIGKERRPQVTSFNLVNRLLEVADTALPDSVKQMVGSSFDTVQTQNERSWWPQKLKDAQRILESACIKDIDNRSDTNERKVELRRNEVFDQIILLVEKTLYEYLDNAELGGLGYVLSFIRALKFRIEDKNRGYCKDLERNASEFASWKKSLLGQIDAQYVNLGGVTGDSFFSDNQKLAEQYISHQKTNVSDYLRFHLEMVASQEASLLLAKLSEWLGSLSVDGGVERWTGLAGRLQGGKVEISRMVQHFDKQIRLISDARKQDHALRIRVQNDGYSRPPTDNRTLRRWADEVLKVRGGAQAIFRLFAEKRADGFEDVIMREVFVKAFEEVDKENQGARASLISLLGKLPLKERKDIFQRLIRGALPWVNARDFKTQAKHFKMYLGVKNPKEFKALFGAEYQEYAIVDGVPLGIQEFAAPDGFEAICYCELSGFCLPKLTDLARWRNMYVKEYNEVQTSEESPLLHTHKDDWMFVHPMEPSDLDEIVKDFKIFIEGVMTSEATADAESRDNVGRLCRYASGQYITFVKGGGARPVGTEQRIRRDGIPDHLEILITERVQKVFGAESDAVSLIARVALGLYYERFVYPVKVGTNKEIQSLWTFVIHKHIYGPHFEALRSLRSDMEFSPRSNEALEDLIDALISPANIDKWTKLLAGTESEVPTNELGKPSEPSDRCLPYVKRCLRPEWKSEVRKVVQSFGAIQPGPTAEPPRLVSPSTRAIHIHADGVTSGPISEDEVRNRVMQGQLKIAGTSVWWAALPGWQNLSDHPDLHPVLSSVPPPPPPPPPVRGPE